jgi:hypothetical protein
VTIVFEEGANPMSSTSVQIFEADRPWAEGMKRFRANVVPGLKAAQKAKMLRSWPLVQTGDHTGMLIFGYPNKSAGTNFANAMAQVRQGEAEAGA